MHIEPLIPGTLLLANSLRIDRVLGQGGFGLTYLCSHTLLRGQVRAVKELAPIGLCTRMPGSPNMQTTSGTAADFAAVRRRFADEAANLLNLAAEGDAVGIVRIHDVWEEFGTVFYSMEYLEGGSPFPRVGEQGATAGRWDLVEPLARDLLGALARLERLRIVHGDIKPANVLVSLRKGRQTATLIDFGSARTGAQLQRTFSSNSWTPGYAAPEWTTPALRAEIGPCTDLYGWGLMVYGAMCRFAATLPDQPLSPIDAGTRVLMNADPYASATRELIAAGVPTTWANAVGQCIRIRSSERPRSAEELLASLVAAPAPVPVRHEPRLVVATEYVRQGTTNPTPAVATPWDAPATAPRRRARLPASLRRVATPWDAPATAPDDRPAANTRRRVTNALWFVGVVILACIAAVVNAVSDAVDASNQSVATAPAVPASVQPLTAPAPTTDAAPTPATAVPASDPVAPASAPAVAPPPVAPEPAQPPEVAAEAAYRRVIDAWNALDEAAYFGGFHTTLACWYNDANEPIAEIRSGARGDHFRERTASRLEIDRLLPVSVSGLSVTFVEDGRLIGTEGARPHRKLIVMQPHDGNWRISVEASPSRHACWSMVPQGFSEESAPSASCVVTLSWEQCATTAGDPPCRTRRSADAEPMIPAGTTSATLDRALKRAQDNYNCEFGEADFGPSGRITQISAFCMGEGNLTWTYEGCD